MKKKLLFLLIFISQIIISGEGTPVKTFERSPIKKKVTFLLNDDEDIPYSKAKGKRISPIKNIQNNDDDALVSDVTSNNENSEDLYKNTLDLLDENPSHKKTLDLIDSYGKKNIDLKDLFENNLESFFKSIDLASQSSLKNFILAIGSSITIKSPLKEEVIHIIAQELDISNLEQLIFSIPNTKDKEYLKNALNHELQIKIGSEKFDLKSYFEKPLVEDFVNSFEDKDIEKIKKEILSLNIDNISSKDDLLTMFNKVFEKRKEYETQETSFADQLIKKLIDESYVSINELDLQKLRPLLALFIKNKCFYGIEKIIENYNFKYFSRENITNILTCIVAQYKTVYSYFNYKVSIALNQEMRTKDGCKEKNKKDEAYSSIILKLFKIQNNPKEAVELFLNNYGKNLINRDEAKEYAANIIFVLAKDIDTRYIPFFIELSKTYKDTKYWYSKINQDDDKSIESKEFLSTLVLKGFFNSSKTQLIALLDKAFAYDDKSLIKAILYTTFSSFFHDSEFIKKTKKAIDQGIESLSKVYSKLLVTEKKTPIQQQNFINQLKALNSLKDDLVNLSPIDHMFYGAYLEYLKGNKQDLRNLVFPVSRGVYALTPQSDSQTQAMSLIRDSLKKIFKEDRIKFLLFDLVETEYQKKAALELLDFMGLRSNTQSSPAAKASA